MTKSILLLAYGEMGPFALDGLHHKFPLLGVVTPPQVENMYRTDAVRKTEFIANESKIPIYNDTGLDDLHRLIERLKPDAVVICTYDKVIPEKTLRLSKFINVHHGDLPKYRGRANLNWAIINGRNSIGVAVHEVADELDAGRIYKMWTIPISKNDYISDIYEKVNNHVFYDLPALVEKILQGKINPYPQKGSPTYCCTRLPEDGKIDWNMPAEKIRNLIRGVSKPFAGAFTKFCHDGLEEKLIIWRAYIEANPRIYEGNVPGRIGRVLRNWGVEVLTGTKPLIITDVNHNNKDCRADEIIRSIKFTLK